MTNLTKVLKGNVCFFIAYLFVLISQYLFIPLIEVLNEIGWVFEGIATVCWFGIFIAWIVGLLIIPNYFVLEGITTQEANNNKMSNITQAILFIIFGITFTIIGWFIFPAMGSFLEHNFLTSLFWIGLLIHWILSVIVAPINKIIANKY